jgi:hypothetical protein
MALLAHEHAPNAVPPALQTWKPTHPAGPAHWTDAPGTHARDVEAGGDDEPLQFTRNATMQASAKVKNV